MGAANDFTAATPTRSAAPTWTRTPSTVAAPDNMNELEAQPAADSSLPEAPEQLSGASLASEDAPAAVPTLFFVPEPLAPLPTVRSDDGRFELTGTALIVRGQSYLLRELERADVMHVRWILWYLMGGLGLAFVMIAFLENWLRTGPAMLGMTLTALLLAYGHRGTNRLRLFRLGREVVNVALPGETPPWQRLTAELNRRIFRVHDHAAREAAALLAAADEATRQAAQAAQAAEEANAAGLPYQSPLPPPV